MNCEPGDRAVIVRTTATTSHLLGLFVRVERAGDLRQYKSTFGVDGEQPTWVCETARPVANWRGLVAQKFIVPDFALRPIRDNDADDETLTWAGKPTQTTKTETVES